jgi:hypothetical protein
MDITKEDLWEAEELHVIDYYDMPLFFITKVKKEKILLNYYIEDDKQNNSDLWFIGEISEDELNQLMNGEISSLALMDSMIEKEQLFYGTISYNKDNVSFELVTNENLDEDALPQEELFLKKNSTDEK